MAGEAAGEVHKRHRSEQVSVGGSTCVCDNLRRERRTVLDTGFFCGSEFLGFRARHKMILGFLSGHWL